MTDQTSHEDLIERAKDALERLVLHTAMEDAQEALACEALLKPVFTALSEAVAERDDLRSRLSVALGALEPFAEAWEMAEVHGFDTLKFSDLRLASQVVAGGDISSGAGVPCQTDTPTQESDNE